MLDLSEKFPLFFAIRLFYSDNDIICIKTVDFSLEFDFYDGPAGKAGGIPPSEHQYNKRRLNMRFKMNTPATR